MVARKLRQAGRDVVVRLAAPESKFEGDAGEMLGRARESDVRFAEDGGRADLVVDAVFGTGFSGSPRREAARLLEELAAARTRSGVDVPSGVDASTGEIAGPAVRAARTVTFHAPKIGLAVAPGRFHAGDVQVADIGLARSETKHARVGEEILDVVPAEGRNRQQVHSGIGPRRRRLEGADRGASLTAQAALRAERATSRPACRRR